MYEVASNYGSGFHQTMSNSALVESGISFIFTGLMIESLDYGVPNNQMIHTRNNIVTPNKYLLLRKKNAWI